MNTNSAVGESGHPVLQIMVNGGTNTAEDNKRTFYCLNALEGTSWTTQGSSGSSSNAVTYDQNYLLPSDLEKVKALGTGVATDNEKYLLYSKVGKSEFLPQILWILDNMYIPSRGNAEQKKAFLERAGFVYGDITTFTTSRTRNTRKRI